MIENITTYIRTKGSGYDFSIIIPSWNNLDYLKLCISSLQKNSSTRIQIIVFINEGNDGTPEWLEGQDDIDFMYSEKNIGICYSLNLCRTLVKSDHIIYLNDDMYVLPNWDLELSREISDLDTRFFMLSATMIEPHLTNNPCVTVKNYGDTLQNFKEELLLKEYATLAEDDWSGSTWPPNVVHVDLWDLVGGLSIEFSPGMYSDPDFSRKLYESGVRIFKGVGKALVYHFGSKSTGRVRKNKGRNQFLMKWGVTSRFFTKEILNMGKPYEKLVDERAYTIREILLNKMKILILLLTKNHFI
jgi:glycosyltransferase involved in cell wall biosynthesis